MPYWRSTTPPVAPSSPLMPPTCATSTSTPSISAWPRSTTTWPRSEEHTSELQSLMRTSYAVFCLKKKKTTNTKIDVTSHQIKQITNKLQVYKINTYNEY